VRSLTDVKTIGKIDAANFVWPINREQSLELLDFYRRMPAFIW
jgi:deoxyribodipyrimidine photolyase-related protein